MKCIHGCCCIKYALNIAWMFSTAAFKSRGELMAAEEEEVDGEDRGCDCGCDEATGSAGSAASSEDCGAVEVLASDVDELRRGGEPGSH